MKKKQTDRQNRSSVMKFGIKSAQGLVIQSISVIPELQLGRHGAVEMSSLRDVKKCV